MAKNRARADRAGESFDDYDAGSSAAAQAEAAVHGEATPEINPIDGKPMLPSGPTDAEMNARNAEMANGQKRVKTKRERFVELAPTRAVKAIKALEALARCADVRTYEYTAEDIEDILSPVRDAGAKLLAAFNGAPKATTTITLRSMTAKQE